MFTIWLHRYYSPKRGFKCFNVTTLESTSAIIFNVVTARSGLIPYLAGYNGNMNVQSTLQGLVNISHQTSVYLCNAMYAKIQSLHALQILSNSELSISLSPNLIHINTRRQLRQCQLALFSIHFKHALYSPTISLSVYQDVSTPRKPWKRKPTKSVIIVLTHFAPVNGKPHFWTIFDDPSFATWLVATTILVLFGLETRSIAPPIPLNTLPGIM